MVLVSGSPSPFLLGKGPGVRVPFLTSFAKHRASLSRRLLRRRKQRALDHVDHFALAPLDHRRLSIWLKPEDLVQLCRIGLDHPDIHFEIFYGASNNERGWWDNHRAIDLGYRPTGRAEDFREHAFAEQAKLKPDPVGDFYQGGTFCGMEFDGDRSRIVDWK